MDPLKVDPRMRRTGFAAALNQDGTVNSPTNPALPGSIVAIFGVGNIAPTEFLVGFQPLGAAFKHVDVKAEYSGPAPGLAPGVQQVNFRIPNEARGTVMLFAAVGPNIFLSVSQ